MNNRFFEKKDAIILSTCRFIEVMIEYVCHVLTNGLRVLVHRDPSTPLATVNLLYCVGSRDESPLRTGFAHLFEHLMFGGTRQVPDYDGAVDALGGEANAFTNCDYTNYYLTVPAQHLRHALTLEANRMAGDWNTDGNHWEVLDVQRKVVTEEYNQRYINQPYGNVWMHLRPLCYQRHPYRWCTIGADIRHVQQSTLDDVSQFYNRFYRPDNAILAIAGNVEPEATLTMVQDIFGPLSSSSSSPIADMRNRNYPSESPQTEPRFDTLYSDVPNNALYLAWHMCDRWDPHFYAYDMLSDLLSNGHSSRLYRRLVQETNLFSELDAYITGDLGPGLFVISGKLNDDSPQAMDRAEAAIRQQIELLQHDLAEQPDSLSSELEKVANKYENTFLFSQYKASDRALSLCYYQMIGDPSLINREPSVYRQTSHSCLLQAAQSLQPNYCSTLRVLRNKH